MHGYTVRDIVWQAVRWCACAFVAVGAAWSGGVVERDAQPEVARPRTGRQAPVADRSVHREAMRGIAELERFLDRQLYD
jgi:hypothetical protein